MNRIFSNFCECRFLLWIVVLVSLNFIPQHIYARLRVTKPAVSTTMTKTTKQKSTPMDRLYCLGYKTLIVSDENGQTQVYVNDDGGDFSTDEKYLVNEKDDGNAIDWDRTIIFAGDFYSEVAAMNVKMTGGNIYSIIMSGGGTFGCTGTSNLEITGGRVSFISLYDETATSINAYLSNLRYTGSQSITLNDCQSKLTLFINTDCEFYAEDVRFMYDDLKDCKGAIVPDSENLSNVFAVGDALIPDSTTLECDYFVDKGYSSLSVGFASTVKINKCDGWESDTHSMPSVGFTKAAHNQITYVVRHASCTKTEMTCFTCDLCGLRLMHSTAPALGHDTITDAKIAATCVTPGLTEGSHCSRCGKIHVEQEEIEAKHLVLDPQTIQMDFDNKKFRTGTSGKWYAWPTSAAATFAKLDSCYSGIVTFTGVCSRCSTYVSDVQPTHGKIIPQSSKLLLRRSCTRAYSIPGTCSKCGLEVAIVMPALNHSSRTKVEGTAATCTEVGYKDYWKCSYCSQKFTADSNEAAYKFEDMSTVEIEPLGHKYGVEASYVTTKLQKAATCTSPASFYQLCANGCGTYSNNLIWYYGSALGHKCRIQPNSLHASTEQVDEGTVTIECQNSGCGKTWPSFQYMMSDKVGEGVNGYWSKVKLLKTFKLPACVKPGWGKYSLTVSFHGTKLDTIQFDNYITPCGYLHNYNDEGKCEEEHYAYLYETSEGTSHIQKTYSGDVVYQTSKVNGVESKVADDGVYTSYANIVVPYSRTAISQWTRPSVNSQYIGVVLTDPETGEPMTYQDYEVTQTADQASFYSALTSQTEPFYANFYDDFAMDICTTSDDMLGTMSGCTEASVKNNVANLQNLDMHGHKIYAYLNDGTVVQTSPSQSVQKVRYNRTFNNANWQALYVPIDMTVADLQLAGISRIAEITEVTETNGALSITIQDIENGWTTPRGIYLVKVDEPGQKSVDISNCSVRYSATPTTKSFETDSYTVSFVGTNDEVSGTTMYDNHYYALGEGKLAPAANSSVSLKPQRWYMSVTDKNGVSQVPSIRIVGFENEEESTALQTIRETVVENCVYTMDGRRVLNSESLTPGIYVQNGRKILIK